MLKSATYLIDDTLTNSSWDFDFRGGKEEYASKHPWARKTFVGGTANGYPCYAKRDFNTQGDGVITFEANYNLISGSGLYFEISDGENECFKLVQKEKSFYAGDKALFSIKYGEHHIKITLNMENGDVFVVSDGDVSARSSFTGKAKQVSTLRYGYEIGSVGESTVSSVLKLYKNYLANDECMYTFQGNMPVGYEVQTRGQAKAQRVTYNKKRNTQVYALSASENSCCKVIKPLGDVDEKACFQLKYLPSAGVGDKTSIILEGKHGKIMELYDTACALYYKDELLRKHSQNVWQTLRVEAYPETSTAVVFLNGKRITELAVENLSDIQQISVCLESQNGGESMFSCLLVRHIEDVPEDYVPEPVVPKKKFDSAVGMLTCSLWREGQHVGWDCITPFEKDHKPLIGWYDEGNPETADWELKWLCEHGVDYQLFCWYGTEENLPFITTDMSYAIHDGYMHAKYSKYVKMALLWEGEASRAPESSEAFRKYFVPYFIDHFFSDERYMTVDGKAVMGVYGPNKIIDALGGAENFKAELDYLRSEVKKLGYDDLIILCCSQDNKKILKDCGFDGLCTYTWGVEGYSVDYTKACIKKCIEPGFLPVAPTVSSGFNLVGWTGYRYPNTTPKDFEELLRWSKDEILSTRDKDSWQSKMVVLATWNEYGEGTYICPSTLHGFGYLDAVRNVFAEDEPHVDVIPTQNQLSRINVLRKKDRALLSPLAEKQVDNEYHGVYKRYEFKTEEDLKKWEFHRFSSLEIKDGRLFGHSDQADPYMILKDDDFLPFSASMVQKVRVHLRGYKPVNQMCCCQACFTNRADKELSARRTFNLTVPDRIAEIDIQVRRIRGWDWKDKITAFRFDPIHGIGDFELVDIEFLKSSTIWDFCIDGKPITLAGDVYEQDGEYYIPFDTTSNLLFSPHVFWEWHKNQKQFVLKGVDTYIFTKDSDIVLCGDKQIKMKQPLAFDDGVPCIPASIFADIIGRKMTVTENVLDFSK